MYTEAIGEESSGEIQILILVISSRIFRRTVTIEAFARSTVPFVERLYGEVKSWWMPSCLTRAVTTLALKSEPLSDRRT